MTVVNQRIPIEPEDTVRVSGALVMEVSNPTVAFILELGRALHVYGTPADRLESALTRCSGQLGLDAQFFSTPTSLFAAFGKLENQRTYLIRVDPGEVNLGKLVDLDAVVDELGNGTIGIDVALTRIREIIEATPRVGAAARSLSFSVIGAGAAGFLGGSWRENRPIGSRVL